MNNSWHRSAVSNRITTLLTAFWMGSVVAGTNNYDRKRPGANLDQDPSHQARDEYSSDVINKEKG